MKVLRRNRIRDVRKWQPNYVHLLPPRRRRYMPWRWIQKKGNSATLAKIIRFYDLETGNRISAMYLATAINIRHGLVEAAPAFKYRGKPRRLFTRNARIRYPHSLAQSCSFVR